MRVLVTGCAGFIGSNVVDDLLARGHEVVGLDNLSTGQPEFLADARGRAGFGFVEGDLLDPTSLDRAMDGVEHVVHLAANADVRHGPDRPRRDLEQNTIGTANVLEAMRAHDVRGLAFASSGSVYGEPDVFPTPEDAPFPRQTSFYGASKLAAEAMIQAACEAHGLTAVVFRFVSILGERYSHGHVFDFVRQLREHPDRLDVLGDGSQRKSYLYIEDCVRAVGMAVSEPADEPMRTFNLGTDETCTVRESIACITAELGLEPELVFAGGKRGWVGDSPLILLDCARIRSVGWAPSVSIQEGIARTVRYLVANEWLLERRAAEEAA